MKLFEFTINPVSSFGTPLKGDTIFGCVCWQTAHDPELVEGGLEKNLEVYHERPFAVFSSAYPKLREGETESYALKRPDLPLSMVFPRGENELRQTLEERKEKKKKQWMLVGTDLCVDILGGSYLSNSELAEKMKRQSRGSMKSTGTDVAEVSFIAEFDQPHNTINRLTQTTGEGAFAPYMQRNFTWPPGISLAIFVLLDMETTGPDQITTALRRIGAFGYGRDASTGLGRFVVEGFREMPIPSDSNAIACYTLAPSVPEKDTFSDFYYKPFTRFGKHGGGLAKCGNPFKNPVIMADEGAVLIPRNPGVFTKPYLGTAVTGISKEQENAAAQGYSLYLPCKWEFDYA